MSLCCLFVIEQNVPPDLSICTFVLEQSLSVRALQEMLANTEENAEAVSLIMVSHFSTTHKSAKERLMKKKPHLADKPPALFDFLSANTEQWKLLVFLDSLVLLLY